MSTVKFLGLLIYTCFATQSYAWDAHYQLSRLSLKDSTWLNQQPSIKVSTLDHFLSSQSQALHSLIQDEELWTSVHLPEFPKANVKLLQSFIDSPSQDTFLRALRLNPLTKIAYYKIQQRPKSFEPSSPEVIPEAVSLFPDNLEDVLLTPLSQGDGINPLDVIVAAVDEPDYGMDTNLWEDNGQEWSQAYGYGAQPFGNPKLIFSTQAPFHMGFFHEDGIVYEAAPFLKRTFPEQRIHLFRNLATLAFKTGHHYWGYRFLGWGLHYIQDLSQPYHAQVFPGLSTWKMLGINILDILGWSTPKENAIQIVSNRHLALENFQNNMLRDEEKSETKQLILQAISATSPDHNHHLAYTDQDPRNIITTYSVSQAVDIDSIIRETMPTLFIDEPSYIFGVTEKDVNVLQEMKATNASSAMGRMGQSLADILGHCANYSRKFVESVDQ